MGCCCCFFSNISGLFSAPRCLYCRASSVHREKKKKVGVCCSLVFRRRRRRRAQRSVLDGRLEGRLGAGEVSAGCGRRRRCRQISPDYPVYSGQCAFSLPLNLAFALIFFFFLLIRKHSEREIEEEKGGGGGQTREPRKRIPGTLFFSSTLPKAYNSLQRSW